MQRDETPAQPSRPCAVCGQPFRYETCETPLCILCFGAWQDEPRFTEISNRHLGAGIAKCWAELVSATRAWSAERKLTRKVA